MERETSKSKLLFEMILDAAVHQSASRDASVIAEHMKRDVTSRTTLRFFEMALQYAGISRRSQSRSLSSGSVLDQCSSQSVKQAVRTVQTIAGLRQ